MIIDNETNFVYFSEKLKEKHPNSANKIIEILKKHNIKYGFLKETKDIWCRDFMPIQISENKFVQFKYEPSYLNEEPEIKSIPEIVCYKNNFEPEFSEINIDGGNVVKYRDKVILTNRIYSENPNISKTELLQKLNVIFKSKVIIIPTITSDTFGHADGCMRFCNDNSIIVSDLLNEYKYLKEPVLKIATDNNLKIHELPIFDYKDKKINKEFPYNALGIYLNYLEVGN